MFSQKATPDIAVSSFFRRAGSSAVDDSICVEREIPAVGSVSGRVVWYVPVTVPSVWVSIVRLSQPTTGTG